MPQVDLETLVSSVCAGGSDRKIACETLAVSADRIHDPETRPDDAVAAPDFPPESFFLSKEAELDWVNQNAFYVRKESHKANTTSSSANSNPSVNPNPNLTSNTNSNSQRISLKHKASMIGLPKPQKRYFSEAKGTRRACKIVTTRLIPKRVGSRFKTDPSLPEPSSPKVSCMGRVRSKRDRSRRVNRQKSGRSDPFKDNHKPNRVKKPGFLASFRAIFRTGGGCKDVSARGTHAPPRRDTPPMTHDIRTRLPPDDEESVSACSPPRNSAGSSRSFEGGEPVRAGLGGVKRFASGRRGDLVVDVDVA